MVLVVKASWTDHCSLSEGSYYACEEDNQCVIKAVASEAKYTNLTSCMVECESSEDYVAGEQEPMVFNWTFSALLSMPLYSFAFNCLIQFPPLLHELDNPTPGRAKAFVFTGISFSLVLYTMAAFAGYVSIICFVQYGGIYCKFQQHNLDGLNLTEIPFNVFINLLFNAFVNYSKSLRYLSFCDQTVGDVLDCYPFEDIYILWGRVALSFVLCCSFPLYSHAMRSSLHVHIWPEEDEMNWKGVFCSVTILLSALGIALLDADIDFILGFTGAIAATQLVVILPMLFMWKTVQLSKVSLFS